MKGVFNEKYKYFESEISQIIDSFENSGESIKEARNKLKTFELEDFTV